MLNFSAVQYHSVGIIISDKDFAAVSITRNDFHGGRHYFISPQNIRRLSLSDPYVKETAQNSAHLPELASGQGNRNNRGNRDFAPGKFSSRSESRVE